MRDCALSFDDQGGVLPLRVHRTVGPGNVVRDGGLHHRGTTAGVTFDDIDALSFIFFTSWLPGAAPLRRERMRALRVRGTPLQCDASCWLLLCASARAWRVRPLP
ncbi:MAG: hypothetical protein ACRBN8_01215 [Nannocystales bacterium]